MGNTRCSVRLGAFADYLIRPAFYQDLERVRASRAAPFVPSSWFGLAAVLAVEKRYECFEPPEDLAASALASMHVAHPEEGIVIIA